MKVSKYLFAFNSTLKLDIIINIKNYVMVSFFEQLSVELLL